MKITYDWLKDHLKTKSNEAQLIEKLTAIGLEVESVEVPSADFDFFKIAKIIKTEKHPDADRLKVCDVDVGEKGLLKVVCGASNAREGLVTIYAPPGATIPKNKMKLSVSKIRGVTSYGMLCSESELNLSDESDGIIELDQSKFNKKIGNKYFSKNQTNLIDLSITPNRPDCLGVKGIARDLASTGFGKLIERKEKKIKSKLDQKIKVKINKEKNQGCTSFGSCLITNIKNCESPKWLKDKLISIGQKPISAVVDITNYVMLDLNRPLHAYDADKIDKCIIVRNSKKGERFTALDNKEYKLGENMCVISDNSGVLGLGGIIGGIRSGTELDTKNVLIESAYFNPRSIRKTSKVFNLDTDAKFRFERGIDPLSIEQGIIRATELIKEICGGELSKIDIQNIEKFKETKIQFDINLFELLNIVKLCMKERKRLLSLIDKSSSILEKKIIYFAASQALSTSTFNNLIFSKKIEKIFYRLNPKSIITTFEGHSFERVLFATAKKTNSKINTIGYQSTLLSKYQNSIFLKLKDKFSPNEIWSSGKISHKILKKKLSDKKIKNFGSDRFMNIDKNYKKKIFNNKILKCLILPVGFYDSTYDLFLFSINYNKINDKKSIRFEFQHLNSKDDNKNWAAIGLEYNFNYALTLYIMDTYNYGNPIKENKIHYYNSGISYNKGNSRYSLNYGRQRGGYFCYGGICRYVPDSTGISVGITKSLF